MAEARRIDSLLNWKTPGDHASADGAPSSEAGPGVAVVTAAEVAQLPPAGEDAGGTRDGAGDDSGEPGLIDPEAAIGDPAWEPADRDADAGAGAAPEDEVVAEDEVTTEDEAPEPDEPAEPVVEPPADPPSETGTETADPEPSDSGQTPPVTPDLAETPPPATETAQEPSAEPQGTAAPPATPEPPTTAPPATPEPATTPAATPKPAEEAPGSPDLPATPVPDAAPATTAPATATPGDTPEGTPAGSAPPTAPASGADTGTSTSDGAAPAGDGTTPTGALPTATGAAPAGTGAPSPNTGTAKDKAAAEPPKDPKETTLSEGGVSGNWRGASPSSMENLGRLLAPTANGEPNNPGDRFAAAEGAIRGATPGFPGFGLIGKVAFGRAYDAARNTAGDYLENAKNQLSRWQKQLNEGAKVIKDAESKSTLEK